MPRCIAPAKSVKLQSPIPVSLSDVRLGAKKLPNGVSSFTPPARSASLACALALIIGGADGNLWDRLQYGYVIDFIGVYSDKWSWSVFNIADSAITAGALLLILDAFNKP